MVVKTSTRNRVNGRKRVSKQKNLIKSNDGFETLKSSDKLNQSLIGYLDSKKSNQDSDNSSIKLEQYSTKFKEVKKIIFPEFKDTRGSFKKFYTHDQFKTIMPKVDEVFFSTSKKNVFRGLHAQSKPYEIEKIIICIEGEIIDFFIDLRKESKYFGEFQSYELSEDKNEGLFIPKGFGHGYQVVSNHAIVMYAQSGIYNSNYEIGINPLSLSSDLNFKNIILSEKDKRLPNIENFKHMEKIKSA